MGIKGRLNSEPRERKEGKFSALDVLLAPYPVLMEKIFKGLILLVQFKYSFRFYFYRQCLLIGLGT